MADWRCPKCGHEIESQDCIHTSYCETCFGFKQDRDQLRTELARLTAENERLKEENRILADGREFMHKYKTICTEYERLCKLLNETESKRNALDAECRDLRRSLNTAGPETISRLKSLLREALPYLSSPYLYTLSDEIKKAVREGD